MPFVHKDSCVQRFAGSVFFPVDITCMVVQWVYCISGHRFFRGQRVMIPLMDWLTAYQDAPPDAQLKTMNIPQGHEDVWDGAVIVGLETIFSRPPLVNMFSGFQLDLKMSDLPGWHMAQCKSVNEITTAVDFSLPGIARDSHVLIGARKPCEAELLVAAIGRLDVVTTPGWNCHHNDVHW